jgi:hypothetical protein
MGFWVLVRRRKLTFGDGIATSPPAKRKAKDGIATRNFSGVHFLKNRSREAGSFRLGWKTFFCDEVGRAVNKPSKLNSVKSELDVSLRTM